MADRVEYYRGYDIAYYNRERGRVRVQIRDAQHGLPPVNDMPLEKSMDAARQVAQKLIDEALVPKISN